MYDITIFCDQTPDGQRYELQGFIESSGAAAPHAHLCHLYDSGGLPVVIGRIDDARDPHESAPAFAARCIAAALLLRPRLEPLPESGHGAVVLGHNDVARWLDFGFRDRRLFVEADTTNGVSLIGLSTFWQLAELVLSIAGGSDGGGTAQDPRGGRPI